MAEQSLAEKIRARLMVSSDPRVAEPALEAVLNLHQWAECVNVRCKADGWCIGCDPDGGCNCEEHPHPCPTVEAVAKALGVSVDG